MSARSDTTSSMTGQPRKRSRLQAGLNGDDQESEMNILADHPATDSTTANAISGSVGANPKNPSAANLQDEQWEEIAGNEKAKDTMYNAIVMSTLFPRLLRHVKSVLLFGPPGTGKTMMVECLAHMGAWTLIKVPPNSYKAKYPGESEQKLRQIFDRARNCSPSILFFDEADSVMAARTPNQSEGAGDIKACLFILLSDLHSTGAKVMIIAATSRPQAIDIVFLRHFESRLYVPLPDKAAVYKIIRGQLEEYDHDPFLDTSPGSIQLELLAGECIKMKDGGRRRLLSGTDIVNAMRGIESSKSEEVFNTHFFQEQVKDGERILYACRADPNAIKCKAADLPEVDKARVRLKPVVLGDLTTALSHANSVISLSDVQAFDSWNKYYGQT